MFPSNLCPGWVVTRCTSKWGTRWAHDRGLQQNPGVCLALKVLLIEQTCGWDGKRPEERWRSSSPINTHPEGLHKHRFAFKLFDRIKHVMYQIDRTWHFPSAWSHTCYQTWVIQHREREDEVTVIRNARVYKLWLWPLDLPSSQNRREARVLIGQEEVWSVLIGWADM